MSEDQDMAEITPAHDQPKAVHVDEAVVVDGDVARVSNDDGSNVLDHVPSTSPPNATTTGNDSLMVEELVEEQEALIEHSEKADALPQKDHESEHKNSGNAEVFWTASNGEQTTGVTATTNGDQTTDKNTDEKEQHVLPKEEQANHPDDAMQGEKPSQPSASHTATLNTARRKVGRPRKRKPLDVDSQHHATGNKSRKMTLGKDASTPSHEASDTAKTGSPNDSSSSNPNYKQEHDVGSRVYANWSQAPRGTWMRGVIKSSKTVGTSNYGDIRTYEILFEDGDLVENIQEVFVEKVEDFEWLHDASVPKGVIHHKAKDGEEDRYMRERGYYEVELVKGSRYASICEALRAHDAILVARNDSNVNKRQMNFPDEWIFSRNEPPLRRTACKAEKSDSLETPAAADTISGDVEAPAPSVAQEDMVNGGSEPCAMMAAVNDLPPELTELARLGARFPRRRRDGGKFKPKNPSRAPGVDWIRVYNEADPQLQNYLDSRSQNGFTKSINKKIDAVPSKHRVAFDTYFFSLVAARSALTQEDEAKSALPADDDLPPELMELATICARCPRRRRNGGSWKSMKAPMVDWIRVYNESGPDLKEYLDSQSQNGFTKSIRKRFDAVPQRYKVAWDAYYLNQVAARRAVAPEEEDYNSDPPAPTADVGDLPPQLMELARVCAKCPRGRRNSEEWNPSMRAPGVDWIRVYNEVGPELREYLDSRSQVGFRNSIRKKLDAIPKRYRVAWEAYFISQVMGGAVTTGRPAVTPEDDSDDNSGNSALTTDDEDLPAELLELARVSAKCLRRRRNGGSYNSMRAPSVDWVRVYSEASPRLKSYLDSKSQNGFAKSPHKKIDAVPHRHRVAWEAHFLSLVANCVDGEKDSDLVAYGNAETHQDDDDASDGGDSDDWSENSDEPTANAEHEVHDDGEESAAEENNNERADSFHDVAARRALAFQRQAAQRWKDFCRTSLSLDDVSQFKRDAYYDYEADFHQFLDSELNEMKRCHHTMLSLVDSRLRRVSPGDLDRETRSDYRRAWSRFLDMKFQRLEAGTIDWLSRELDWFRRSLDHPNHRQRRDSFVTSSRRTCEEHVSLERYALHKHLDLCKSVLGTSAS